MTDNTIRLRVGGREYAGWSRARITRGIERACSDFKLVVSERWPGSGNLFRIRPGDECRLYIGGDPVITGWVDETAVDWDATSHTISVAGRSKTSDLVDCSAVVKTGQVVGGRVEALAAILAAPYGVKVIANVDTGAAIADFQLQQGEGVFEAIDRAAKLRALIVTDDPSGNLVITRAGKGTMRGALVTGENILRGRAVFSGRDRFRNYICKAQSAGNDFDAPSVFTGAQGAASDAAVRRPRTLVIIAEGQADAARCALRAQWEASVRRGKASQFEYVVQGWRDGAGALWRDNTLVTVRDAVSPFEGALLIAEVEFSIDERSQGTLTRLKVAPREAYDTFEKLETKTDQWSGVTGI